VLVSPPLLYAGAFVIGSLCQWMAPMPILPVAVALWAGLAVLLCGAALAAWSRRTLEAKTNIHPSLPATALVVTGPFRLSRNPMYLARTLLYVGLALLANALWVLSLLVPLLVVMHYGVITREERYLEVKFGDAYRRYRAGVRRWI
jgi:protein-S-isoprenylcysteine O-methyltransferase Ste14